MKARLRHIRAISTKLKKLKGYENLIQENVGI